MIPTSQEDRDSFDVLRSDLAYGVPRLGQRPEGFFHRAIPGIAAIGSYVELHCIAGGGRGNHGQQEQARQTCVMRHIRPFQHG